MRDLATSNGMLAIEAIVPDVKPIAILRRNSFVLSCGYDMNIQRIMFNLSNYV